MTDSWQRYQQWLLHLPDLDFYLDVSRMAVEEEDVTRLAAPFDRAFAAMEALEPGAIANPDEGRMVGHYRLRGPQRAPSSEIRGAISSGLQAIERFAADIHQGRIKPPQAERFTDLLAIGIGGSALGLQFVAAALAPDQPPLRIHFIDNTDPAGIDRVGPVGAQHHDLQGNWRTRGALESHLRQPGIPVDLFQLRAVG